MKKAILWLILVVFGIKYGIDYLLSEDFQKYGDRTKSAWTCKANMVLARIEYTFEYHREAQALYRRTILRCPKTEMAENAAYGIAECYDQLKRDGDALAAYQKFLDEHEKSPLAGSAQRAITRIKSGHIF